MHVYMQLINANMYNYLMMCNLKNLRVWIWVITWKCIEIIMLSLI